MTHRMTFAATVAAGLAAATLAHAQNDSDKSACAGGWSVTDVDGNGYVSPIEMDDYARRQAVEMDSDGSGTISREEFVNCANVNAGKTANSETRTEEDMAAMDIDESGTISAEEYMNASRSSAERAVTGNSDAMALSNRLLFAPEGSLSSSETMTQGDMMTRSAILFVMLDRDQDTALTQEEFMAKAPPVVDMSEVLNREFDAADSDSSGDLTTTELIALNERRSERAAQMAEESSGEATDPEVGAPVVYYTYPSTM
ncbi:MAG: EF-hand domain-containing protein [Sulfitobacter sp.]|nr:EF-hand domain-containing protein [Sulfitobacter sp.]